MAISLLAIIIDLPGYIANELSALVSPGFGPFRLLQALGRLSSETQRGLSGRGLANNSLMRPGAHVPGDPL